MRDAEMLAMRARMIEDDVARVHGLLIEEARRLANRLTRLAARLEQEGIDASVNEYGEIQGSGPDIDRLCVQLHAARGKRDLLRTVARRMEEGR
jgi:hypothetical protein